MSVTCCSRRLGTEDQHAAQDVFTLPFRFISNKYLVKRQSRDYDVEWGYAFDVHLNAFYPLLVILHFIQLFFINRKCSCLSALRVVSVETLTGCFLSLADVILTDTFIGYLVGNTLWLIAVGYYIYVTFLGYSGKFWWNREGWRH